MKTCWIRFNFLLLFLFLLMTNVGCANAEGNASIHSLSGTLKNVNVSSLFFLHPLAAETHVRLASNDASNKPQVKKLTAEFRRRAIQETDSQLIVKNFKSKKALIKHLSEVTRPEIATKVVDRYYIEQDRKLMIIPTEFIPWFQPDKPYTLIKKQKNEYLLKQKYTSDLHGNVALTITFKKENDHWIISHIQINDFYL